MTTHQSLAILAELRSQIGFSIPGWVAADGSHKADVETQPTNSLGRGIESGFEGNKIYTSSSNVGYMIIPYWP